MGMEDMSHEHHMMGSDSQSAPDNCCAVDCECNMMSCQLMPLAVVELGSNEPIQSDTGFGVTNPSVNNLFLSNLYRPPILS